MTMNKITYRKLSKTALSLVAILALSACSENAPKKLLVLSVSDYDYTMNNLPAVSINLGPDINNFCSITLNRKDIAISGLSISSKQRNNSAISANCNWDGSYYLQSSKHPTQVSIKISNIDTKARTGTFDISLKLINNKDLSTFIEAKDTVQVSGKMFDNLLAKSSKA